LFVGKLNKRFFLNYKKYRLNKREKLTWLVVVIWPGGVLISFLKSGTGAGQNDKSKKTELSLYC
jgi:hypothetical protein